MLKNGHIMFDKAFGTYTGKGSPRVESTNIYDLASLSKTTGTLLAIMKLYDKGRFNLTDKISDHLPFLQRTDKKDITIQEILYHQSGLPSWIPFIRKLLTRIAMMEDCSAHVKMSTIRYRLVRLRGRIRNSNSRVNIFLRSRPVIILFRSVTVCG